MFLRYLGFCFIFGLVQVTLAEDVRDFDQSAKRLAPFGVVFSDQTDIQCSGSLIASDMVLTAAHCVVNEQDEIARPDQVSFFKKLHLRSVHGTYGVKRIVIDDAFLASRKPTFSNVATFAWMRTDIALLILENPIPNKRIKPIPIAEQHQVIGAVAVIGFSDGLDRPTKYRDCQSQTFGPELIKLSCEIRQGTSGGALVTWIDDDWYLVGLAVGSSNVGKPRGIATTVTPERIQRLLSQKAP